MKLLVRDPVQIEYPDDVDYMVRLLAENGYLASHADVQWAWRAWSDDASAGWLQVRSYDDEEILEGLLTRLHEFTP